MNAPVWHKKSDLVGHAFYIGDEDQFATNTKKGWWYWTKDKQNYFGPYSNLKKAEKAYRKATIE